MSDTESVARAVAVCKYCVEHGPNDFSRAVLSKARRVLTQRLDDLGGASDIPEFEPGDPRIDDATVRQAVVTMDRVAEDVSPADGRVLKKASLVLDERQVAMQQQEGVPK